MKLLARFLVVVLLLLGALVELAGPDNLGLRGTCGLVRGHGNRHEGGDLVLVVLVLGILSGADEFGQPGRALEEHHEGARSDEGPAAHDAGGEATPLVEDEPDQLLGGEVGMTAVGPETGSDEAAVEVGLGVAVGDLGILEVLVFDGLVFPLLAVADVLDEHEKEDDAAVDPVGCADAGLEVRSEEDHVGRGRGEDVDEDALDQCDEGGVQKEEGDVADLFTDNGPAKNKKRVSVYGVLGKPSIYTGLGRPTIGNLHYQYYSLLYGRS